jgi:hypothetical protein
MDMLFGKETKDPAQVSVRPVQRKQAKGIKLVRYLENYSRF